MDAPVPVSNWQPRGAIRKTCQPLTIVRVRYFEAEELSGDHEMTRPANTFFKSLTICAVVRVTCCLEMVTKILPRSVLDRHEFNS